MSDDAERAARAHAVCVMGMHRSGTSYAASALRFLGCSLGDPNRHMKPGGDNPAGYFELQSVMELNEELLAHLGGAWDQPPVLEPGWELDGTLAPFRDRAVTVLRECFASDDDVFAFKDPRLSLLLPFWKTVCPIAATIVLVRDPLEVAASLGARRYVVAPPQAASLWLRYLYAAVANDPGHLLVHYGDFYDDLPGTLTAVARHLGLTPPDAAAIDAANAQLDPTLRHHDTSAVDVDAANPLMAMALEVWNEGAVDLDALSPAVADAMARGWLRPPADGELLARARAEAVKLRETLRARNRQDAQRAPS